jgi:p-aminobenzoyl-glutamate transporter AbgT
MFSAALTTFIVVAALVLVICLLADGYARHTGMPASESAPWWRLLIVALVVAFLAAGIVEVAWTWFFAGVAAIRS